MLVNREWFWNQLYVKIGHFDLFLTVMTKRLKMNWRLCQIFLWFAQVEALTLAKSVYENQVWPWHSRTKPILSGLIKEDTFKIEYSILFITCRERVLNFPPVTQLYDNGNIQSVLYNSKLYKQYIIFYESKRNDWIPALKFFL